MSSQATRSNGLSSLEAKGRMGAPLWKTIAHWKRSTLVGQVSRRSPFPFSLKVRLPMSVISWPPCSGSQGIKGAAKALRGKRRRSRIHEKPAKFHL